MEHGRGSPAVSIGLPVYNGANFVAQAVESILAQTFEDFELIVMDNCSEDETPDIVREYAARDSRILLFCQPTNVGAARNFNDVFTRSSGRHFKWAAHDDVLQPEFLAACVAALESRPEAVLSYPLARVIDAEGAPIEDYTVHLRTDSPSIPERFEDLLLSWHRCYEVFGLIRSDVLRSTRLMAAYGGADRTLLQELAMWGPFVEVPLFLFHSRRHSEQSVAVTKAKVIERMHWFDTTTRGRLVTPAWDLVRDNLRLVREAPVPATAKLRLATSVARWSWRHGRELAQDAVRATRHLARRSGRGRRATDEGSPPG